MLAGINLVFDGNHQLVFYVLEQNVYVSPLPQHLYLFKVPRVQVNGSYWNHAFRGER